jgi:hypothetical protein
VVVVGGGTGDAGRDINIFTLLVGELWLNDMSPS